MKRGVSIRTIAFMEGLEPDYTGKICSALARQHNVAYEPDGTKHKNTVPPGLSDLTNKFRRAAATKLYLWEIQNKRHFLETCRDVGLTQAAQRQAKQTHGPFDWHLSHFDRWATAMGITFEELMLELMFDPATAERMKSCMKKD